MRAPRGLMLENRRQGRRWHFASAVLDENSWTLLVHGGRVAIEAKPLELLHELLLRAGDVVTKAELLDAIWPEVSVVEASLPTAVLKLRRALGDDGHVIETVPRIGYRLTAPVEIAAASSSGPRLSEPRLPEPGPVSTADRPLRWPVVAGALALAIVTGALAAAHALRAPAVASAPAFTQRDAADAIRKLDVDKIEALLRAGWSPETTFDDQNNGALAFVLNICEWDPAHDRKRMLLMARTLLDGGARLDHRNTWGDTPYSIAKARRYCGPDHPVTQMLRTLCYAGYKPIGDRCLATYEAHKPLDVN